MISSCTERLTVKLFSGDNFEKKLVERSRYAPPMEY